MQAISWKMTTVIKIIANLLCEEITCNVVCIAAKYY